MTQEEIDTLVAAKDSVIQRLTSYTLTPKDKALDLYDTRLLQYTSSVISNPTEHCLWELLSVERFFKHLNRPDVTFNAEAYTRFIRLHETVKLDSESGRRSFECTPVQTFQYANIYALYRTDGTRLTQKAVILTPRKFSKSTSTAVMCLNELINGPANAQVAIAANSEKQSKNTFRILKETARSIDKDAAVFNYTTDRLEYSQKYAKRTDAFAFPVASNADTLDGLHLSLMVYDEWAQVTDSAVRNVLTTSMKGRQNPLQVYITTASDKLNTGVFYAELAAYKDILLGMQSDPDPEHPIFLHIFEPDPNDDPYSEATWQKVHPHYGITCLKSDYVRDLADARVGGARALVDFKTKMLNIWTTESGDTEWLSSRLIRDASQRFSIEDLASSGLVTALAVDMSSTNDFTCIGILGYSHRTKKHYYKVQTYFPKGRLETHPNSAIYTRWADEGYLTLVEGNFIDQAIIADEIIKLAKALSPQVIYYDAWHTSEVKTLLTAYGYSDLLRAVKQTNAGMTVLCDYTEKVVQLGKAVFDSNPIIPFCFSNAVLEYDNHDNKRIVKRGGNNGSTNRFKIDAAVVCVMAAQAFFDESFA